MSDDPYKVLQVDPEADPEIIQAAYRRLAQKYHPDRTSDPAAASRMAAINRAWHVVGDPGRRAAYDGERARQPAASGGQPTGATGRRPSEAADRSRAPDVVSPDWTSGRSVQGGGYDPASMRHNDGYGAAGSPPGKPSGSVLNFGRYAGWSLGEIVRRDPDYIEWLDRVPIGRAYRAETDAILRRIGRRSSAGAEAPQRRGLFRRS